MEKRETFAQALCEILVKHNVINEAEGRAFSVHLKVLKKKILMIFYLKKV